MLTSNSDCSTETIDADGPALAGKDGGTRVQRLWFLLRRKRRGLVSGR